MEFTLLMGLTAVGAMHAGNAKVEQSATLGEQARTALASILAVVAETTQQTESIASVVVFVGLGKADELLGEQRRWFSSESEHVRLDQRRQRRGLGV